MSSHTPIKSGTVASIVRESASSISSDKSTLITSLNYNLSHLNSSANSTSSLNTTTTSQNSNNNSSHFYQNVPNFKQLQNILHNSMSAKQHHHHHQQQQQAPPECKPPAVPSTPVPAQPVKAPSLSIQSNNTPSNTNLPKTRTLDGYVGFANLPNQVYRKSVKKGFEFNLMVIGESGLGKSTFINSLFLAELYNPTDFPNTFERRKKTTFIDATSVLLSEKGVNLRLTVVDTPGFGDSIDNSNCWQPIIEHIDSKYEDYLNAESKINRKLPINDQRIHCCLHFISPGHT